MKMQIRWFTLTLLLSCTLILTACKKTQTTEPAPPFVMVTQVAQQSEQTKSYAGQVQARQQIPLSFRVGGQVLAYQVDVGEHVKAGQVLAKLDTKDTQLQINSAKAELEQAQSAMNLASIELKRYQSLLPSHAVSQSQYDSVENQYKNAQSQLTQAQTNYNNAKNQNQYHQLISERSGVITQRNVETGQVVSAGQVIYQLATDGERDVVIGVGEQDVKAIQVGQSAWVSLWTNEQQKLPAQVREISPATDSSQTYQVKIKVNAPNLQLGQTARVFFQQNTQDLMTIPLSAVSAQNQQSFVWTIDAQNILHKTPVQVHQFTQDSALISSGLTAQQWVVMAGVHLLHNQQKVQPIDRDNRAVNIAAQGAVP